MVFSSVSFIILFLPLTVFLYYLFKGRKYRNAVLLVVSILFYAMGEPVYILLLLGSSVINYFLTILMCKVQKPKAVLAVIVPVNVLTLCAFKFIPGLPLPIGISFYTFQIMSYCIDVYRDPSLLQKNYAKLLLYISFFPQLIAGPIVRYSDVAAQIDGRETDVQKVAEGLRRFIFGLAKKVIIANTLGNVVDTVYAAGNEVGALMTWTAAVFYALQIYYDFSGYSDMAIGLGRMFGFEFKENFLFPYEAGSIKEFWRRWHVSLSTWFKEYLYIPLGGNRKGKARTILNKYIVFLATGLWHGADITFVIWGLIHGTFSVLEECGTWARKIEKSLVGRLYTAAVVIISFVFFRADSFAQSINFIKGMFGGNTASVSAMNAFAGSIDPFVIAVFVLALVFMTDIVSRIKSKLNGKKIEAVAYAVSGICLIFVIMSLASSSYNPFIYFRF